mgnify:CR=1 FL=1
MVQRCRGGGEVQRSREVAAGAGCRGAEEVQRWCSDAEVQWCIDGGIQRCRDRDSDSEMHRWCSRCRETEVQRRCRGAGTIEGLEV